MVQFDDIIFFGWVDTNYLVGSVPAASVGNAVFAHVVGTAPWNMHVFALPRMKSYAWCWHDIKLMLRHVRVGGGVGGVMLTFMCTCIMKLMLRHVRVGFGVGGVMLTFMCTCIMKLMLRHVRVGCGVGGVMLTFMRTCIMKLMLRHVRVGCGVGGVMLTFMCTCIMKLMLRHVRVGGGVDGVMLTFLCTCIDHQYSVYESIASHCFRWVEWWGHDLQAGYLSWKELK